MQSPSAASMNLSAGSVFGADALPSLDTIVAVSTPTGTGAIGIVRMSGPAALALGARAFRPARGSAFGENDGNRLRYGHIVDPETGVVLDEVLAVGMLGPSTYTREDVVEVHCHGGPAAQRAVLQLLMRLGARPAEPGEFTQRAFLNGRIDLTQAEGVAGIVRARTASALRAGVRQLSGGLSDRLRSLRGDLIGVLAQIEAGIDFTEEDLEELDRDTLGRDLAGVGDQITALLGTAFLGRALEQGVRTAIVGRPNVGKSSLLNALLMRERAIVSDVPGTTRDTVEDLVEIAGIPLHLVDTAGLRASADAVELLGIERSREALREADLVLAVFELPIAPGEAEDGQIIAELDPRHTILVANKRDTVEPVPGDEAEWEEYARSSMAEILSKGPNAAWRVCAVSARSGDGISALRDLIEVTVVGAGGVDLDEPLLATERQRNLTAAAAAAVTAARTGLREGVAEELVAEDVRDAVRALGSITGEELVPDLIDEIFRRFCIGK
ncbi:MAG: tRNA uridine-5-carboxymethylaminomethyl(34) synthesis GTPase MnmE [Thermoleophilia bacterium]